MKTLQEIKSEVAKNNGYCEWSNLFGANEKMFKEVLNLHSRSVWDAACEAQLRHLGLDLFKTKPEFKYPQYKEF